jgi:hypothetical protein
MSDSSTPVLLVGLYVFLDGGEGFSMILRGVHRHWDGIQPLGRVVSCEWQPRVKTTCILTF